MRFTRVERRLRHSLNGQNEAFLVEDGWDDYGFKTLFDLVLFGEDAKRINVGQIKILSRGLAMGRVSIPDTFSTLGPEYCSLGQDENYYETIAGLPEHLGAHTLRALRDCVQDPSILAAFRTEQGFRDSLLRSISESSILTTFSDALKGQARLTPFKFAYRFPKSLGDQPPQAATFNVRPASMPPTNVHVIIGRNGVGKTMLLWNIASLLCQAKPPIEYGQLEFLPDNGGESGPERFTNLVTVTFSAFDPFRVPHAGEQFSGDMRYAYVGLRKPPLRRQLRTSEDESFSSVDASGDEPPHLPPLDAGAKDLRELSSEFQESLARCLSGPRRRRWIEGVRTLETDPGFEELGIPSLLETELDDAVAVSKVSEVFDSLSAGHRIVLLIVTRLVELVDERTLVLLDEPEAHLHPPLLSSFIRVLSALLILRNGAAIVATHSPVVLQEVPKDCVWVLRRSGETVHVERPDIETFGENTGVLTREVFGLEVTKSGFHQLIAKKALEVASYEDVIAAFGRQLGAEARAIVRALTGSGK